MPFRTLPGTSHQSCPSMLHLRNRFFCVSRQRRYECCGHDLEACVLHDLVLNVFLLLDGNLDLLLAAASLLLGGRTKIVVDVGGILSLDNFSFVLECASDFGGRGLCIGFTIGLSSADLGLALARRLCLLRRSIDGAVGVRLGSKDGHAILDLLDVVDVLLPQTSEEALAGDDGTTFGHRSFLAEKSA